MLSSFNIDIPSAIAPLDTRDMNSAFMFPFWHKLAFIRLIKARSTVNCYAMIPVIFLIVFSSALSAPALQNQLTSPTEGNQECGNEAGEWNAKCFAPAREWVTALRNDEEKALGNCQESCVLRNVASLIKKNHVKVGANQCRVLCPCLDVSFCGNLDAFVTTECPSGISFENPVICAPKKKKNTTDPALASFPMSSTEMATSEKLTPFTFSRHSVSKASPFGAANAAVLPKLHNVRACAGSFKRNDDNCRIRRNAFPHDFSPPPRWRPDNRNQLIQKNFCSRIPRRYYNMASKEIDTCLCFRSFHVNRDNRGTGESFTNCEDNTSRSTFISAEHNENPYSHESA
ncbi:unnamed protein product [Heligmosomoides polygyrus]|uniref:Kazal-like domain-containing protein n=1 Tax=Heligmosomoides polygyrus TaxID=6339 RepID=A0A183FDP1_HELPZ|nr:unnamed protein product [Heligmosomoides polygyrus]